MRKITIADVGIAPKHLFDAMPKVTVTFDDETEKVLFDYYPDEITFVESELLGLTEDEAHALRHKKDVEYLQS